MRIARFVTALAGAGLVFAGPSAVAASPTYPAQAPTLTVSANSIVDGGTVAVTGRGFMANSPASETWTGAGALGVGGKAFGGAAGTFAMGAKALTADASGMVTASIRLLSVGDHIITLAGTAANGTAVTLSTVVTVDAVSGAASGTVSHTGAPLALYAVAGLLLGLLGALAVMLLRNRRRSSLPVAPAPQPQRQTVG